jgi:hypothetical protein
MGDSLIAANAASAPRLVGAAQEAFSGKTNTMDLFSLNKDGRSLNRIEEHALLRAANKDNLSGDQVQLAYAYMTAINSKNRHEILIRNLGDKAVVWNGLEVSDQTFLKSGGGFNWQLDPQSKTTFTAIVNNAQYPIGDKTARLIGPGGELVELSVSHPSSLGELLSHETLGHGVGRVRNLRSTMDYQHKYAIQMTNLYLRAANTGTWRSGAAHGKTIHPALRSLASRSLLYPTYNYHEANQVPSFFKMPIRILRSINLEYKY